MISEIENKWFKWEIYSTIGVNGKYHYVASNYSENSERDSSFLPSFYSPSDFTLKSIYLADDSSSDYIENEEVIAGLYSQIE